MQYPFFKQYHVFIALLTSILLSPAVSANTVIQSNTSNTKLVAETYSTFDSPWAMSFLPNDNLIISEKSGKLFLFDVQKRSKTLISGVPEVAYGGQGGLGDVVIHPQFKDNNWLYISYVEEGKNDTRGAVVIRAELKTNSARPSVDDIQIIWRQFPKVTGYGHYSHRLAISQDGYLFITSGDRQKQLPAQRWDQNLGKVIRLHDDGSVPDDNPFQTKGVLAKTFWSLGHRNMLGISFDKEDRLWTHEMGPRDGDELNLTVPGENYGWPIVSEGNHYSGTAIPSHETQPQFHPPEAYWVPTIAPSGLVIYDGSLFPNWHGNAFIGGLRSMALLRIDINGNKATEAERFSMNKRIREVEQGPKGALWVLEDGSNAKLLKLTPYK